MIGPEFFPTPANIARQMLDKISTDAANFLEPSAGRGDIDIRHLSGRSEWASIMRECLQTLEGVSL